MHSHRAQWLREKARDSSKQVLRFPTCKNGATGSVPGVWSAAGYLQYVSEGASFKEHHDLSKQVESLCSLPMCCHMCRCWSSDGPLLVQSRHIERGHLRYQRVFLFIVLLMFKNDPGAWSFRVSSKPLFMLWCSSGTVFTTHCRLVVFSQVDALNSDSLPIPPTMDSVRAADAIYQTRQVSYVMSQYPIGDPSIDLIIIHILRFLLSI